MTLSRLRSKVREILAEVEKEKAHRGNRKEAKTERKNETNKIKDTIVVEVLRKSA